MSILIEDLRDLIKKTLASYQESLQGEKSGRGLYEDMLEAFEKPLIEESLFMFDYNQKKTADFLGIHRNTLSKKIKQFEINKETA